MAATLASTLGIDTAAVTLVGREDGVLLPPGGGGSAPMRPGRAAEPVNVAGVTGRPVDDDGGALALDPATEDGGAGIGTFERSRRPPASRSKRRTLRGTAWHAPGFDQLGGAVVDPFSCCVVVAGTRDDPLPRRHRRSRSGIGTSARTLASGDPGRTVLPGA